MSSGVVIVLVFAKFDALTSPSRLLSDSSGAHDDIGFSVPEWMPFVFEHRKIGAHGFLGVEPHVPAAGLALALFFGQSWPTRRAVAMKCLAVALMFAASVVTAATADESCKDQARENKFTGETLKNFMTNCKDVATMMCDGQAIDQKLSDEAKDTFTKKCIKDAVGSK